VSYGGIEDLRQDSFLTFSKPLNPMEKLIVSSFSEACSLEPIQLDEKDLLNFAMSHEVASTIAWQVAQQDGWQAVPLQWRQVYDETEARISAYLAELDQVAELLSTHKIGALVMENGALARAIVPKPGLYGFGDFDFLVAETALPEVQRVIEAIGYHLVNREDGRFEYRRIIENGEELRLNFQTSLVARRFISDRLEPDFEALWSRSRSVPGSQVRILGTEDFLFQLCIHNASHGYVRKPGIRLHLDVDWYLRAVVVDWPTFLRMAEQYRIATRAYFALLIPKELFGTPAPDEALMALRPPEWKRKLLAHLIYKAGLFNPHERKFGKPAHILFAALLYDDWRGLWRSIFPDPAWMRARYGFSSNLLLPYYHGYRLFELVLCRVNP
jgi:hypothetical protein